MTKLIFEKSQPGRSAVSLPKIDVEHEDLKKLIPAKFLRKGSPNLPEVSELELVRHYIELSHKNFSIDSNFYPLGSCTMKYNPKINEKCSGQSGFVKLHPLQPEETVQGILKLIWELEGYLSEIAGMDATTLQPAAGAQGELLSLLIIKSYLRDQKKGFKDEVLIPDSAHGTNPASCRMTQYKTIQVKTNKRGCVDMGDLAKRVSEKTACMMITNPNTLGIFEENIVEISEMIHRNGGLMYMDGANMNAIIGLVRPAAFGIDVMHFNLHKTFSTPHGGGGPGAGAVSVKGFLTPYLPVPRIIRQAQHFSFKWDYPKTIGKVTTFYGNVNILIRAYTYIRSLGKEGLANVARNAVLNANYLLARLKAAYHLPYNRRCMHEFVISASNLSKYGVRTLDVAKRLIDYGFHPPTIYFPLIVPEALMIEPTETENKQTLDSFADALIAISKEAKENPEIVKNAPHKAWVKRLDEVKAAREAKIRASCEKV